MKYTLFILLSLWVIQPSSSMGLDYDYALKERLIEAIKSADIQQIRALIAQGAQVNDGPKDSATSTYLHSIGDIDVAELLIDNGADVNAVTKKNNTPLHCAVLRNNLPLCELLLSKGACVNAPNYLRITPLHLAVCCGHSVLCELLISKGANFHFLDCNDDTPLDIAIARGNELLVGLLISSGSPISKKNTNSPMVIKYTLSKALADTIKEGN